jgi:vacuolar-type H+-ATPase subunit H
MDDQEILKHLLNLESEARALVDDAQAEADRRVSEGERQNRALYEEAYAREVESLEDHYTKNLAEVKEDYRKQLEAYRETLKAIPHNMEDFSSLAEKLLFYKEA